MNFKSKILIISLILIFAVSVSAVSANENVGDVSCTVEQNTTAVSTTDDVDTVDSVDSNQMDENLQSIDVDDRVSTGEYGTFTELKGLIDSNTQLKLTKDYMWDISFNNGSTSGIPITKAITIDGDGHTLSGADTSRVFKITGNNVVLKNIIFADGLNGNRLGAIFADGNNGRTIQFINCTFKENGQILSSMHTVMKNCTSLVSQPMYFTYSCDIDNCSFRAAIRISDSKNNPLNLVSTVKNSNITERISSDGNGVVTFKNCNITNGSMWTSMKNSQIVLTFNFINCNFTDFQTSANNGCGLNIYNSTFNNVNNRRAVYYYGKDYTNNAMVISNCSFINCSSTSGGAIYVGENLNLAITNCQFINNTASECGGAIYECDYANVTLTNCDFINNTARIAGNDTYMAPSDQDFVYVGPDGNGTGTSLNDIASIRYGFSNVKEGGILYFTEGIYNGIEIYKPVRIMGLQGSIFHCTGTTAMTLNIYADNVEINNVNFINMTGWWHAGAVWWKGDNGKLLNSRFINSTASGSPYSIVHWQGRDGTISGCEFINGYSQSQHSGALCVDGENLRISDSKFYNNTGVTASAIYSTKLITITNCEFKDNFVKNSKFKEDINENNITLTFTNADNLINAIHATNITNVSLNNVRYWEGDGFKNTNDGYTENKSGYVVNVVFYEKVTKTFIKQVNLTTDDEGKVYVNDNDPNYYKIVALHPVGPTRAINYTFELGYGKEISKLDIIYSNNINPGDDLLVVANLNKTATGTVTFTLNNQTYVRNISDGQAVLTLKAYNLVGLYTITALYSGDSVYYEQDNEVILAITPVLTSNVVISNDDVIALDDTVTLMGKVNFNIVNGVLQFVIKSGSDTVIVNGTRGDVAGVWTADYTFAQTGNYVISAQYYGINMDVTEGSVTVRDISQINVSADAIDYKQDAIIKFTVPVNATGVIALTVGNKDYNVPLTSGHNGTILYPVSGLNAGEYTVIAEYLGDLVFAPSIANTTLTVNKINTELIINSINNNNIITLSANIDEKATGNIFISIGGNIFNVNSGEEKTVSGLEAGVYDISAVYNGDTNFNSQTNMSNVVVTKKPVIITASANPIMEGETAIITVTSNVNITGFIFIEIGKDIKRYANIN
ncbi:MAG: Ig-like domain repeat protein, partial [Methanobrevibacter thaueri]|nr:Ig-like domain repeat protein [Methanobrevibacter thaueri]